MGRRGSDDRLAASLIDIFIVVSPFFDLLPKMKLIGELLRAPSSFMPHVSITEKTLLGQPDFS